MNRENQKQTMPRQTIDSLSLAIYTVNRHAKTAQNPKFLYLLKHEALKKMLRGGKAKKVGLHFSQNPRLSQQQSDVLVKCGNYTFHIPPTKKDFEELPHLGKLDHSVRNPKANLSLGHAKRILTAYTGITENNGDADKKKPPYQKPVFKKLGESYF